ncbi:MAG: TIGR03545 family protein [Bdellovibrio sp.]|nr:TIGR03545 family protein [Bdellovibrio sp.]
MSDLINNPTPSESSNGRHESTIAEAKATSTKVGSGGGGAPPKKVKKPTGPIRWNAIIPFAIFVFLIWAYFFFFFDLHMKKAIEWGGYKALGTELNIGEFKSSFINGNVEIRKLEITDAAKPELNSIELSSIRFAVKWDALLRVKFVIQEIAVEGVQFMSKRAHVGKVAPPEPPSNEPSFTAQLQNKALNKLEKDNQSNVLGDVSAFLKTGKWDDQIKNLESQMASKKLLEDLNVKWAGKKTEWDAKLKTLPSNAELQTFKTRFEAIKYKDFKTPQELDSSIKQFDALFKDVDSKNKQISQLKSELETDLKSIDTDYKSVDAQVKKDIDSIKTKFKIPKIDAASFAKALFMQYLTPIMSKVDRYKALAEKYLPPKYSKMIKDGKIPKQAKKEDDETIQPHPRAKGTTYEFPVKNGYPLFWIQKISISSKSNNNADYGDFSGLIENITSNQRQIGKLTTLDIKGDFKKMNVSGIHATAELNNLNEEPQAKFGFNVGAYPLENLSLLNSKDGQISIPKSVASFTSSGQTIGFKNYTLLIKTEFSNVAFKTEVADKTISDILNQTFSAINRFDVEAKASGELKDLNFDISSSLGLDLQHSFENVLKAKIAEANAQLQKAIDSEIGKLKAQLTGQTDALKNQANGEVAKVQNQLDSQKKQVDERINAAKKDLENQAKKHLQDAGKKGLDDLKKQLGF